MEAKTYDMSIRKIFKNGDSLVVTIPIEFLRKYNLETGDKVKIFYSDELRIKPVSQEKIEKELGESPKIE